MEKAAAEAVEEREKALEDARRVRARTRRSLCTEHSRKTSYAGSRMREGRAHYFPRANHPGGINCFLLART